MLFQWFFDNFLKMYFFCFFWWIFENVLFFALFSIFYQFLSIKTNFKVQKQILDIKGFQKCYLKFLYDNFSKKYFFTPFYPFFWKLTILLRNCSRIRFWPRFSMITVIRWCKMIFRKKLIFFFFFFNLLKF